MKPPHISVLMPVYNAADTLATAVDSIIAQHETSWELIMVDDGSTDTSPTIMAAYAQGDPRIRHIRRERCGIVEALSTAAECAQGALLARMDADDHAEPVRLTEQAALFERDPDLALCGGRVRMIGHAVGSGRKRYEAWINSCVQHEAIIRDIFVECPIPHPTFMMSRAWFDALGGYRDQGWPEDYDLVLRIWQQQGRFAKPDPVLLHWRNQPERLSMTDQRYGEKAFRALKRHFLYSTVLHNTATRFFQWGAGEVGKKWLREWPHPPEAVVDINPRKIGRTIHHVPVIAPEALPPPGECVILVAVGAPGARDEIRDYLCPRGYDEPAHFRFIA